MKAIVYKKYGPPDVLQMEEVEKPTPKDHQVLIKIHASSINAGDYRVMRANLLIRLVTGGLLRPKDTRLGSDVAGRVEAVGASVKQFRPGDEVFGFTNGAFAEYGCSREGAVALKPANISFEEAAAVPVAAITALQGLRDAAGIRPGQKVLIQGASGGVGMFAVQLAKHYGAEVTTVCSTKNLDMVRSIGADHVIDYTMEDFTRNSPRYDLIFAVNDSPKAEEECLPNTLSITFPGVENAGLMGMLDYRGIAVSAGSACSTGEDKPSHVLKAIGLSDQAARETIRISLGHSTSERNIRYMTQVVQDDIEGRTPYVNMLTPAQLNETILFDEQTYILDVRPEDDRRKFKGLPNSHEASPFSVEKYLDQLPKDKQILVVCPGGGLSFMISYYLKARGFKRVSNLRGGLDGWRKRRSDLYQKYAGQNLTVLQLGK